jgi:hypothetical protein
VIYTKDIWIGVDLHRKKGKKLKHEKFSEKWIE